MNVEINIVEAAAELAEKSVRLELEEKENLIYVFDKEGNSTYTEEAQELFNAYYDEYFDLLLNCKTLKEDD
jgi:hypothetical protein